MYGSNKHMKMQVVKADSLMGDAYQLHFDSHQKSLSIPDDERISRYEAKWITTCQHVSSKLSQEIPTCQATRL